MGLLDNLAKRDEQTKERTVKIIERLKALQDSAITPVESATEGAQQQSEVASSNAPVENQSSAAKPA